ncbi:Colorectal mutant cancer protein [Eumeta japonica]|uniref:Colorectal mutant cancer protein n=1 Tax=Eumeta variegata TaxID=151549 RepID=A0A4C1ZSY8_EUMVA|nr:Colorectal mutant cancer protein [Eumeta japonica]
MAAALGLARARCARLEADARVLECALARATDTAHRLSVACGVHESAVVCLCGALRAADRALETYDVLLALAETAPAPPGRDRAALTADQRDAAELVARRLLARLDAEADGAAVTLGEPLLSPGPWLEPRPNPQSCEGGAGAGAAWDEAMEARLRRHAARLKSETAALRAHRPPPQLFSHYEEEEAPEPAPGRAGAADMETAVLIQEALSAREERAAALAALAAERARVAALTAALARAPPPSAPSSPRHAQVSWLTSVSPTPRCTPGISNVHSRCRARRSLAVQFSERSTSDARERHAC